MHAGPILRRTLIALLFVAPLTGACRKKPVVPDAPAPPPVQSVEVGLQVSSINPSSGIAGQGFGAKIFGSGFKQGASVKLDSTACEQVRVLDDNTISCEVPGLGVGTYGVTVTNMNGESSTLRGGLSIKAKTSDCKQVRVFFDYDRSSLTGSARSTLDGKLSCLQQGSGAIKVEGHCDERGTVDYNLALGQRRANSVKDYLAGNGVSRSRVTTVSYGEEKPMERGSSESAYSKNRRAEILAD